MNNDLKLLKRISQLHNEHYTQYSGLLEKIKFLQINHLDDSLKLLNLLTDKIGNYRKEEKKEPFNIILAASDIYYYENYHSDVIAYILEKKPQTIKSFIKFINNVSRFPEINITDYGNAAVVREENKIDVLIKDELSNHCIIIENKINDAGDMPRQLPRYYDSLKENYTVDRIIYLSLDGKKRPDTTTWTLEDRKLKLHEKTDYIAASDEDKNDLVNSFLMPCMENASDEQEKSFYYQYIDLLKFLRRNYMDYQLMEKFYKEMLIKEQYDSANSIYSMLDELITFRRDRLDGYFMNNYKPFDKPYHHKHDYFVFEYIRDISPKESIKLDVFFDWEYTKLVFKIQETKLRTDLIGTILEKIGEEKSFVKDNINAYNKIFKFPEEEEMLYSYITKLLNLLDINKDKINQV